MPRNQGLPCPTLPVSCDGIALQHDFHASLKLSITEHPVLCRIFTCHKEKCLFTTYNIHHFSLCFPMCSKHFQISWCRFTCFLHVLVQDVRACKNVTLHPVYDFRDSVLWFALCFPFKFGFVLLFMVLTFWNSTMVILRCVLDVAVTNHRPCSQNKPGEQEQDSRLWQGFSSYVCQNHKC